MDFLGYDQYASIFSNVIFFSEIWYPLLPIPMQFTDLGIEGVVPPELLPPHVRSKYQAKPNDRSKRAKKEDVKGASNQVEETQV